MFTILIVLIFYFDFIYSSCPDHQASRPMQIAIKTDSPPPIVYLPPAPPNMSPCQGAPMPVQRERGGGGMGHQQCGYNASTSLPPPILPTGYLRARRIGRRESSPGDDYDFEVHNIEKSRTRLKEKQMRLEKLEAQIQAEKESMERQRELERQKLSAQKTQLENQRARNAAEAQEQRAKMERDIYDMRRRADEEIRSRMMRDDQAARQTANEYYRKIREWESKIFEMETKYRRILNDISLTEIRKKDLENRVRVLEERQKKLEENMEKMSNAANEGGTGDMVEPLSTSAPPSSGNEGEGESSSSPLPSSMNSPSGGPTLPSMSSETPSNSPFGNSLPGSSSPTDFSSPGGGMSSPFGGMGTGMGTGSGMGSPFGQM